MRDTRFHQQLRPICMLLFASIAITGCASGRTQLAGEWELAAADDLHPDGTRTHAFGPNAKGLLFFGEDGRYSLQIFRPERPRFATGDKRHGTLEEYQAATLGTSAHIGRYAIDADRKTITFDIEHASFPNWDSTRQVRAYELVDGVLTYRLPPAPDGTVALSSWRRIK